MMRSTARAMLGTAALALMAGCAYQDPLALPNLGPPAHSSQQYPGYNPYAGYGSTSGYGSYGHGYAYGQGYDPYYYGGRYPQYYAPGVVYVPYPVPCVDGNRDGRCDKRPSKDHDNDGDGNHHGNQGGDGDRDSVPPRYQRDRQRQPGDGPRLQNGVTPGNGAAVVPYPRRFVPAQASPAQMRPPQPPPRRVAPTPQGDREPRPAPRLRPSREAGPAQEP